MITLTGGLYAWYKLPACEIPLRLPFWLGRVEHYNQATNIVHLRPVIPGYEYEIEEVHLTQVVAWFEIPLDNGSAGEMPPGSPHQNTPKQLAEQVEKEKAEGVCFFYVKSR